MSATIHLEITEGASLSAHTLAKLSKLAELAGKSSDELLAEIITRAVDGETPDGETKKAA